MLLFFKTIVFVRIDARLMLCDYNVFCCFICVKALYCQYDGLVTLCKTGFILPYVRKCFTRFYIRLELWTNLGKTDPSSCTV